MLQHYDLYLVDISLGRISCFQSTIGMWNRKQNNSLYCSSQRGNNQEIGHLDLIRQYLAIPHSIPSPFPSISPQSQAFSSLIAKRHRCLLCNETENCIACQDGNGTCTRSLPSIFSLRVRFADLYFSQLGFESTEVAKMNCFYGSPNAYPRALKNRIRTRLWISFRCDRG